MKAKISNLSKVVMVDNSKENHCTKFVREMEVAGIKRHYLAPFQVQERMERK